MQSGTDSPMTDDDTTSSESDSKSDRQDKDDNLTEQTHGERLLEMAKAIRAEESENNARTRAEAPRPTGSAPRTTRQGPTTTRHRRPPAAQRIRLGLDEGDDAWLCLEHSGGKYHTTPQQGPNGLQYSNHPATRHGEEGLGHGMETHASGGSS